MKFLSAIIFAFLVTLTHFAGVQSMGKALTSTNDQSDSEEPLGKALNPNHVEKSDSSFVKPKRFIGKPPLKNLKKLRNKFYRKKYWTKKKFLGMLKYLGISVDNKYLKLFKASSKLIKELQKSKNNIIDNYKPPNVSYPCGVRQADEETRESKGDTGQRDHDEDAAPEATQHKEMLMTEEDDENDTKDWYAAIRQQRIDATKDDKPDDQPRAEKRGLGLTDLCHETFSTTYVLAYAKFNYAYKIPNVRCPVSECVSKSFGISLGRCHKKEKNMEVFVISKEFKFKAKTVTVGCACECLVYSSYA